MPAGDVATRDGRGPWVNSLPAGILAEFGQNGMPLCIDYEHQSVDAGKKIGPTPAAGWIHELASRDGEIWGRVAWTDRAAEMIAAAEYRYISPVFRYDKQSGVILRIVGAGLTNNPNLYLQAVAKQTEGYMNELLERICYMLNLPTTSTPEEIGMHLDRLREMVTGAESAAASAQELARTLGIAETSPVAEVATALASRFTVSAAKETMPSQPDLSQFVPRAEFDRVATALNQIQDERARERTAREQEQAERTVADAIKAGKIAPALKDWGVAYCQRDPQGFEAFVAKAPVIADGAPLAGGEPPAAAAGTLDDADREVCRQMGISEDDYKKTREA